MLTHKSTRIRFWTSILILLHLVALLLPASATPAFAQAGNCPDQSVQSASADTPVVPVGDQQVVLPKETVNKAVIVSYWDLKSKAYDVPNIVTNAFLLYSNLKSGSDFLEEFHDKYTQKLNDRRELSWLKSKIGYDDIVHTMLDVALDMPDLAPYVPIVWKKLSQPDDERFFLDPKNLVASSAQG